MSTFTSSSLFVFTRLYITNGECQPAERLHAPVDWCLVVWQEKSEAAAILPILSTLLPPTCPNFYSLSPPSQVAKAVKKTAPKKVAAAKPAAAKVVAAAVSGAPPPRAHTHCWALSGGSQLVTREGWHPPPRHALSPLGPPPPPLTPPPPAGCPCPCRRSEEACREEGQGCEEGEQEQFGGSEKSAGRTGVCLTWQ